MKIIDVIKYEGDNSTFVWKHPNEDFSTGTQLIVHESQEAILFLNGQALDLFGPGRHTLETQNIPFLQRVLNISLGNQTPFHCEVYFINKVLRRAIKWGTQSKIQYTDPKFNLPLEIGASGELELKVEDSRKILITQVGTESLLDEDGLYTMFRGVLNTKLKTYFPQVIKEMEISLFDIDVNTEKFSEELKSKLEDQFSEMGLSLVQFHVMRIVKPEGDRNYEKMKNLYARDVLLQEKKMERELRFEDGLSKQDLELLDSQTRARSRNIEGYTYQEEQDFEVKRRVASNEGVGNFSNLGMGLGMMNVVSNSVGGMMNESLDRQTETQAVQPAVQPEVQTADTKPCIKCEESIQKDAAFCNHCGEKQAVANNCSGCGTKFTDNGKFCSNCGFKREDI